MIAATIAMTLALGGSILQAARETPRVPPTGTGVVSGVLVTDDTDRRPLRRARVTLNSSDREVARTVITDDAGLFSFTALPAGHYLLSATKSGYVTLSYGARRWGRLGTPLVLDDGQRLTGLSLRLPRGAVITGTILDPSGEPARGVNAVALRYTFSNGERRLLPAGSSVEASDDRGTYRIYGLPAGEYVVAATLRTFASFSARDDIRLVTDAEVRAALAELSAGGTNNRVQPRERRTTEPSTRAPTIGYAPVFYPGSTNASQAGTVAVGAGEERGGIDFQLQLVPTAKVEGSVVMPDGTPVRTATITMINTGQTAIPGFTFDAFRTARPDAEGRFTFSGVTPGQYTIAARGGALDAPGSPRAGESVRTPPLWATADIGIEGQNVSGLTLTFQPGFIVSGKIVLAGSRLAPPQLNRLRVNLSAVQTGGEVNLGVAAASVDANGQFTIAGATPGRYKLTTSIPGARPDAPGWALTSSTIDGQETLDVPFALKSSVDGAIITLTDTPAELSGTVLDSAGKPAPDYYIVVFAADRQYWLPQSRRIQSVRPAATGKYVARNLPAGEYLVAAVVDVEPGEWFDPAFLQQLAGSSFKITIADGEKKVQDVAVSRQ